MESAVETVWGQLACHPVVTAAPRAGPAFLHHHVAGMARAQNRRTSAERIAWEACGGAPDIIQVATSRPRCICRHSQPGITCRIRKQQRSQSGQLSGTNRRKDRNRGPMNVSDLSREENRKKRNVGFFSSHKKII